MRPFTRRIGLVLPILVLAALIPVLSQTTRPTIAFRIILVGSRDAAERILARVRAGENFVALAAAESDDPSSTNGGLVGPVPVADLRPQLRSVLDALRPGELSDVIQLPTGFGIVKLVPNVDVGSAGAAATTGSGPTVMGSVPIDLSAAGSVRYVADVSGYIETVLALRNVKMTAEEGQDLAKFCQVRRELVASAQKLVQDTLLSSTSAKPLAPIDRAQAYVLQSQLHAFRGDMTPAIAALQQAEKIAGAQVPALRLQLIESLGVAYLHKAEQDNGLYDRSTELDLLPPRQGLRFTNTADLTRAIQYFTRYLNEAPDEYEVRWLLNIAHMYAGTYPGSVPKAQLIPPAAFASGEQIGRFVDVAERAGLRSVSLSGGVSVDDFDGDGRLDVVVSSIDSCAPLRFFRRTEDGRFTEQGSRAGLGAQLGGLNIMQADYNNDGNLDILVLRGAWESPQRKSLLRNNGDGTFTDVTASSGLASVITGTQAGVWVDFDNDGFLDLFVGNENGRWPDLYVSNLGGTNFLYHNNHNGTFTEFGRGAGVPGPGQGFPTWFFDYDNDGYDDL